jgi:histidyl-tRNA synthetase
MATIKAIKGTYDILPGAVEIWQRIETVVRDITSRFGYEEIRTPIFENTGLFARSIGEDTDIVGKEMYSFTDKGDRSLTLRPEGTASVVRAFVEHHLDQRGLPQKLWYMGPMFRQERPQKGRQRQFHQFGVEAIGSPSPYIDAETIILFDRIAQALGLGQRTVSLNSLGGEESRERYREALTGFLANVQAGLLCENCERRRVSNPLRVLDCKVPGCREAVREATDLPKTVEYLTDDDREHFEAVRRALDAADVKHVTDPFLVRGLDYYTGTVYEMNLDELGAQSAVMGGGRYDRLITELGGPDLPAVGFACGIERLVLALAEADGSEGIKSARSRICVVVPSPEHLETANRQVQILRDAGHRAETDSLGRSMKAQMKAANRSGADYVLIPESNEPHGMVSWKKMETSEQETATFEGFLDILNTQKSE